MHELLPTEIAAFHRFWSGELYLDLDKAFYRELGEGKVQNCAWDMLRNWRYAAVDSQPSLAHLSPPLWHRSSGLFMSQHTVLHQTCLHRTMLRRFYRARAAAVAAAEDPGSYSKVCILCGVTPAIMLGDRLAHGCLVPLEEQPAHHHKVNHCNYHVTRVLLAGCGAEADIKCVFQGSLFVTGGMIILKAGSGHPTYCSCERVPGDQASTPEVRHVVCLAARTTSLSLRETSYQDFWLPAALRRVCGRACMCWHACASKLLQLAAPADAVSV